jgi:hypothetical protein
MARAASMRCRCQRQHRETKRDDDAHGNAVTTLCRFAWLALHLHYFFTVVIFLFFSAGLFFFEHRQKGEDSLGHRRVRSAGFP